MGGRENEGKNVAKTYGFEINYLSFEPWGNYKLQISNRFELQLKNKHALVNRKGLLLQVEGVYVQRNGRGSWEQMRRSDLALVIARRNVSTPNFFSSLEQQRKLVSLHFIIFFFTVIMCVNNHVCHFGFSLVLSLNKFWS